MSKLDETHRRLSADLVSVKTQWIATRQAWRDSVGDRFEKEFWQSLEQESTRYLNALQKFLDEIEQADINTR